MVMITPSRWFTGGRGLNEFRKEMLEDKRLKEIVDYTDSKDCFPGVDIAGGVSYFLWSRDYRGECRFTNMCKGSSVTAMRNLNEFVVFPRQNDALAIIHKVRTATSETLESMVGPQTPFGLVSSFDGNTADGAGMLKLKSSRRLSYVSAKQVTKNNDWIPKYKVIFSKATCEHAGTPDKNGQYRVFSSNGILCPDVICTQSYLVGGTFDSLAEAENYLGFLHSKFARFLLLQALTSQDLSKEKFLFVPKLDWNEQWTDEKLFAQFGLTNSEIEIINSTIREMPEADSFVIER